MTDWIVRPDDDDYPTDPPPIWALLSVEAFPGGIWECCAGGGNMAAVLREAGHTVRATTWLEGRHDRAFPKHRVQGDVDFLQCTETTHPNIVTNPPFGKLHYKTDRLAAEKIIRHAVALTPAKIALLLPSNFLGGEGRKEGLFAELPPARFYQFSDRIKFYPRGVSREDKNSPPSYVSWFIWEYPFAPRLPQFAGWLNSKDFADRGAA